VSAELSPQTKKKIDELLVHYPKKEAALLPVLHLVQQEFGAITREEEQLVAALLNVKPIRVREVVTFYTMLRQERQGRYLLQVCSNLTCTLAGSERLIDYLKRRLGVGVGETTPDNKFTRSTVECLGACDQAPCMMVNLDYYTGLTEERIEKILEGLK
jgi:NADH-quinone oxidoreductase subunit E